MYGKAPLLWLLATSVVSVKYLSHASKRHAKIKRSGERPSEETNPRGLNVTAAEDPIQGSSPLKKYLEDEEV